ncbi:MAG: amidohydrolase family protein [Bryobacteraceae bacterium]
MLLTECGLSPEQALHAATAAPAKEFGLIDRGRIQNGRRADLLLVKGDPSRDIRDTRNIVAVWKEGVRIRRDEVAKVAKASR